MRTEPATAPPPDQSRAAMEIFAQAVLEGTPAETVLSWVLDHGRPGTFSGVAALRAAVARRRLQIDEDLWTQLVEQVRAAKSDEYRALFADPDDLARLEEAELLGLPDRTAALHQALRHRTGWRSPAAQLSHGSSVELVSSVVSPAIREAADDLSRVDHGDILEMAVALRGLGRMVADGVDELAPELELLQLRTAVTPEPATSVEDLVDQLGRRARAQAASFAAASSADLRRLQVAREHLTVSFRLNWDTLRHMGQYQPPWQEYLFTPSLVNPIAVNADLDLLDQGLAQDHPGAQLDDVDPELLEQVLGRSARRDWEDLLRTVRAATLPGAGERRLDEAGLRRQLPAAALRRGMTPRVRRSLTGPAAGDESAVVVVLDAAGDRARWPAIRAAGLAAGELVRRHSPSRPAALVLLQPNGEATAFGFGSLVDLTDPPRHDLVPPQGLPHHPEKLLGVLRRTVVGLRAEEATVVLVGAESMAAATTRVARRWEWTVHAVPVEVGSGSDADAVTVAVRNLVDAMTAGTRPH